MNESHKEKLEEFYRINSLPAVFSSKLQYLGLQRAYRPCFEDSAGNYKLRATLHNGLHYQYLRKTINYNTGTRA